MQARHCTLARRIELWVAALALAALVFVAYYYRLAVHTKLPVLQNSDASHINVCTSRPCVCPRTYHATTPSLDPAVKALGDNGRSAAKVGQGQTDVDSNAFLIPNVYHFVRFDQPIVTFVEMLAIKSVLRLNPQLVLIHGNKKPEGKFWDQIKDDRRLLMVHREPPVHIYGKTPRWVQHKSDLVRIQVLREYGGIYMDNDCILLRSVDHLRKGHHCIVAKSSKEKYLGNMFLMAAMGCRFLVMYEDLYRTQYNPDLWYYNGGELPTTAILDKFPGIAHIVDEGIEMDMIRRLFAANEPVEAFSKTYDMLHTFYRLRRDVHDTTDYDIVDYRKYNNSFANIARWLLDT